MPTAVSTNARSSQSALRKERNTSSTAVNIMMRPRLGEARVREFKRASPQAGNNGARLPVSTLADPTKTGQKTGPKGQVVQHERQTPLLARGCARLEPGA